MALAEWGIKLVYRLPGSPHFGGHVERLIGTMMGAVHLLPGTTQSSVLAKGGYDAEAMAAMTLREFDRWFALEICRYNNSIYSSLDCTPVAKWETLAGEMSGDIPFDMEAFRMTSPSPFTIHSVFDSNGRRIAEYNETSGALIREYVWNGWEPVAVIEGGVVYYIRADHIARPVFATNSTGVKVWTATYTPFGGVHASTGALPTARFLGQWFQSESGLHQNWMRDYDPTTGRYLQADPLGLIDGASVYGYAGQSPMMNMDPTGECFGPAAALLPACIAGGFMLYDYLTDDCYTWTALANKMARGLWAMITTNKDFRNPTTAAA